MDQEVSSTSRESAVSRRGALMFFALSTPNGKARMAPNKKSQSGNFECGPGGKTQLHQPLLFNFLPVLSAQHCAVITFVFIGRIAQPHPENWGVQTRWLF